MNKKAICCMVIGVLMGSGITTFADRAPILKRIGDVAPLGRNGARDREEYLLVDNGTGVEYFVLMGDNGAMTMCVRVDNTGKPKINNKWKGEK